MKEEEARARAYASTANGDDGTLRWRGRDEAMAVGIDVVNPLNVPLVLTEVGRWVGWKGEGIICSGGVLLI